VLAGIQTLNDNLNVGLIYGTKLRLESMGRSTPDLSKVSVSFEPIGNIPPAEAEQRYYAMLAQSAMAA
jgi:hypothetical protein